MVVRTPSALVTEARELLTREIVDPRPGQVLFLLPVALEVLLRAGHRIDADRYLLAGLALTIVATVLTLAVAHGHLPPRLTILVPLIDIGTVGLMGLSPRSWMDVAVVFPAIWLGVQFGARGWALGTAAVLTAYAAPLLLQAGFSGETPAEVAQTSLVAITVSATVALAAHTRTTQAAAARVAASRLEQAARDVIEQRRLTESIVQSVDVGLIAIDADGIYDSMNPRHMDFMALAFPDGHDGLAGQLGFVYAADGTTLLGREEMPTVLTLGGQNLRDHLIWVGEDPAHRRALAVSSQRHHTSDGVFGGAVMAYHDITELVLASRIKEEFVASVSHELRTPLTSIVGYVDIILEDSGHLDEEVRQYLTTVQRNARRLHRLVDDLLSSALQSVSAVLDLHELSISKVLHLAALEAARTATCEGIRFSLEDPEPLVDLLVEGDAERLTQVFDNLFSNAVKFTERGGSVLVGLRRDGDEAVVVVSDTGRGIAAEELDAVFAKFFRNRAVQREAVPGVGLGLAISKAIVEAHGGTIAVRSTLGRGSTFEVRLPLVRPRVVAEPEPEPVSEPVSGVA